MIPFNYRSSEELASVTVSTSAIKLIDGTAAVPDGMVGFRIYNPTGRGNLRIKVVPVGTTVTDSLINGTTGGPSYILLSDQTIVDSAGDGCDVWGQYVSGTTGTIFPQVLK